LKALSVFDAHDNKAQTQRYIESKRKNRILFEHDKMQQEGDNCSCRMFVLHFFAAFCAFEGLKAEYSRAKYIIL